MSHDLVTQGDQNVSRHGGSGYGRATAVAIAVIFFLNGFTAASWIPRLPEIRDDLGVSDGQLGLTLVGVGVGGVIVSSFSATIADRFGSRQTAVGTAVVLSLLLPLVGFAGSAGVLFAVLIGIGLFDGLTDVAMNAQAIDLQNARGDQVLSRFHGLWSLGTLTGGAVCAAAAGRDISVRTQLLGTAVVLIASALAALRWLIPTPGLAARRTAAVESAHLGAGDPVALDATAHGAARSDSVPSDAPGDGRTPRRLLAMLFLVGTTVALTEIPALDWGSVMWTDRFDYTDERAALAYVASTVGMVIGRLVGDTVIVRVGADRARRGGALLAALGVFIAATAPNGLPLSAIGLALAGFGASVLFPLMFAASTAATGGRTVGMAAFSTGARAGFLLGPLLIGGIATLTSVAVALPVVCGAAAIAVITLRPAAASR